jgi:type VI secretion system protein ImpK
MRDELANVVLPVITYGLRLKDRLEHGEDLDLGFEQTELKKLLKSGSEARRWPAYGGQATDSIDTSQRAGRSSSSGDQFLGARYALVCWLDEIFILDSSWANEWNEQKLETGLYDRNDRADEFWEQLRRCEARMETDALEVYYLCVMLGFRGRMRERPDKLRTWRDSIEAQITKHQSQKWQGPQELQPTTNVPPLRGRERLRQVMLAIGVVLGLLIPTVTFLVVYQLGK